MLFKNFLVPNDNDALGIFASSATCKVINRSIRLLVRHNRVDTINIRSRMKSNSHSNLLDKLHTNAARY